MAEQISAQSVADANVEAQKLQKKPGKRRVLTGKMGMVITVLAIGPAIFQLYTAFFGVRSFVSAANQAGRISSAAIV